MGQLFAKQCVKSKYERKFVLNGESNNGKFSNKVDIHWEITTV